MNKKDAIKDFELLERAYIREVNEDGDDLDFIELLIINTRLEMIAEILRTLKGVNK